LKRDLDEIWDAVEKFCWIRGEQMKQIVKERRIPVIVKASGIYLEDAEGKRYIDGSSGAVNVNIGHGNERVVKAIKDQVGELQFSRALILPSIKLCEKIAQIAPGDLRHTQLSLTGSDAVETAIRIARKYYYNLGKYNHIIISQWLSYHGTTLGTLGATGITPYRTFYERYASPGFYHVFPPYCYRCFYGKEYPDCDLQCARTIEDEIKFHGPSNVAAFIGEPVIGGGGVIPPPDEYWPIIRDICNRYGILLIFDEVITGFGRTGKLFACEHWGTLPDIMTLSKGINSAYIPLSATVARNHVYEAFLGEPEEGKEHRGGHTSDYYPLGCIAALANIQVILENKLWENAAEVGSYLKKRLEETREESAIVGDVRGKGLLLGVEIVKDKKSKKSFPPQYPSVISRISRKCVEKDLILLCFSFVGIEFMIVSPPLITTKEQADTICDIIADVLKETEHELS